MKKKWIVWVIIVLIGIIGYFGYKYRIRLYSIITSRGLNSHGGDITIVNARIWTGESQDPWKTAMTVRNGKIVAMDAENPAGRIIDARGRLVVPGFCDGHTHPQCPYVLTSPEAPTLFGAKTPEEVLERLRKYVGEHPEDKFPRLFGWMSAIFKEGEKPTRQMIDKVVSDRPVYLVHHSGHAHWVNTKALELADALEKDPPWMKGNGHIERDPKTGLATGFMEETEYAATHGVLLNTLKKIKPLSFDEQVLVQRYILEEYSKVGVTSIWTKDGDIDITHIYEQLLKDDSLPVRAILDNLFTPYSDLADLKVFARRGEEIKNSPLPKDFLRTDAVKLVIDLPVKGWIWMFEPYTDGSNDKGKPAFPLEYFRQQMLESDKLGLQINICALGDMAVHESLNIIEEIIKGNPPRNHRHIIEHAEFIQGMDIPRFRELGVIATFNPICSYPDEEFQAKLSAYIGKKRLSRLYQRYKDLIKDGAIVVSGSDFPLAPMDPLIGMHILVTGTDINGKPEGGLWPHKQITIEEALRTYTTNPAYATFKEDRLGKLKEGYYADFAILSENILSPDFKKGNLAWVKANLTVLNGHIVHKDFSDKEKVIDFAK